MMHKVISGGQTGVDQAALRAARAAGIPTGGWAPNYYRTEDGPAEWLADYGLVEHASFNYRDRTEANILMADATLIVWMTRFQEKVRPLFSQLTGGTAMTYRMVLKARRPRLVVVAGLDEPHQAAAWIAANKPAILNVAGPRESKCPGIGLKAEQFLVEVFRLLAAKG